MPPTDIRVLAFVPEIMTMVRIQGVLSAHGIGLDSVDSEAAFAEAIRDGQPSVTIVDLGQDSLDIRWVVALAHDAGVAVIAFGRHTDTAGLREARAAGADAVYIRGKFMEDPAAVVRDALSVPRPSG